MTQNIVKFNIRNISKTSAVSNPQARFPGRTDLPSDQSPGIIEAHPGLVPGYFMTLSHTPCSYGNCGHRGHYSNMEATVSYPQCPLLYLSFCICSSNNAKTLKRTLSLHITARRLEAYLGQRKWGHKTFSPALLLTQRRCWCLQQGHSWWSTVSTEGGLLRKGTTECFAEGCLKPGANTAWR